MTGRLKGPFKGGPKKSERAPFYKPGYEPGGLGWLVDSLISIAEQRGAARGQATSHAKGTPEYRKAWTIYYSCDSRLKEKRDEILEKGTLK